MDILKLTYNDKVYHARTFTTFIGYFEELKVWSNAVYNARRRFENDMFKLEIIELMPPLKEPVENDKRKENGRGNKNEAR